MWKSALMFSYYQKKYKTQNLEKFKKDPVQFNLAVSSGESLNLVHDVNVINYFLFLIRRTTSFFCW